MKKNRTPQNTIITETLTVTNTGELDFEMYEDILGHDNVEIAYEENGVETIHKGEYYDNWSMKIEDLKNIIAEAESKGCNYIAIDYNCDHPDYKFFGVNVHPATEAELEVFAKEDKMKKDEEAERLLQQAETLIKRAKQLKNE